MEKALAKLALAIALPWPSGSEKSTCEHPRANSQRCNLCLSYDMVDKKNYKQFVDFIEARNMRLILVAGNKKTLESHSTQ